MQKANRTLKKKENKNAGKNAKIRKVEGYKISTSNIYEFVHFHFVTAHLFNH